jgi:hypothetical protein
LRACCSSPIHVYNARQDAEDYIIYTYIHTYLYTYIHTYIYNINICIYPPPRHVQHFVFEHVFNDAKGFVGVGGGPDGHETLLVYAEAEV